MKQSHQTSTFLERLNIFRLSSIRNRKYSSTKRHARLNGAIYYTFAAYLFVTTIVLSDAQIFTANTGFTLPIISLSVPFLGFFVLAPLALLVFHAQALRSAETSACQPNEPDEAAAATDSDIGTELFFVLSSPATLATVFWRLADYQSINISLFHATILGLDLWLSWRVLTFLGITPRNVKTIKALTVAIAITAAAKAFVCWDTFARPWPNSIVRNIVLERDYFIDEEGRVSDPLGLIPNITIDRTKLLLDVDRNNLSTIAALHGYKHWQDYFDDRGIGADIRGRSLRLAYLHGQNLPRLWAHDTQMQGSNLSFAYMPGAAFVGANLQDADLRFANLSGAYLDRVVLRDAILATTNLKGASLDRAQLQGAYILQTDFKAAWLPLAEFELSQIVGADFSGAYLEDTKFWGAMYLGPSQHILSSLSNRPAADLTPPTNEKLQSWGLSSPIMKVGELGKQTAPPVFLSSDTDSIDTWVTTFCTDPLYDGNKAAVKLVIKTYSLTRHPALKTFSEKIRSEEKCAHLYKEIAEDRKYLNASPSQDETAN